MHILWEEKSETNGALEPVWMVKTLSFISYYSLLITQIS